jgi:hypothetical protein
MKPIEIVERIKAEKPELLGKVPDKKAAQIIRAALLVLGKQVASMEDGVAKVPGLGNFRVKMVEREKDGQKVKVRKVGFANAKPVDAAKLQEKRAAREAAKAKGESAE